MTGLLIMMGAALAVSLASIAYLLIRGGNLGDFLDGPTTPNEGESNADRNRRASDFSTWHDRRILSEVAYFDRLSQA